MKSMWTDYLPIIVSAISLVLAMFSLGWNVYRDVIMKPRARVSVSHGFTISQFQDAQDRLFLSAVNHGPGKIRLSMIWFRRRGWILRLLRKQTQGVLFHDWENPISGQLPITLDVGEKVDFVFPWTAESVLSHKPTDLGLRDSFDNFHWAPRREVRKVLEAWQHKFGTQQP